MTEGVVPTPEEAKSLWGLEPGARHLNHGAFGGCPTELLAHQATIRARMERQPARFFLNDLPSLLREAAAALAAFVGTAPEWLGFVDNASTAVNAVVASAPLVPGDEIVTTDHVYNAVRQTLRHHAARAGASVIEAPIGMPVTTSEGAAAAVTGALGPRTKLVVIDHVGSPSAVILPIAPIIAAARGRGIPVLVDGAHAPGLLPLSIDALGATWYAGNCHKWLCSPKGAGFLAVAQDAPWEVHPTVISHAYGQGFTAEFDKTGTRDPSAWLTVAEAIRFHQRIGGAALRMRNDTLAQASATALAADIATPLGAPADMFAAMATIRLSGSALPGIDRLAPDWPTAGLLRNALWECARIEAPVMALGGALWLRLSVQAYVAPADLDGLAAPLAEAVAIVAGRAAA
ncbi:aminotransferase class V-fold PLP-dependent enzyme [Elioraea sp.]|uniref:aminotransferase class V-fold PLP-dependent enzyme n=1 Tax=Elioraea sp. TaxID=2185103 RepID=UPI0025BAE024|nr:aminotransferase class V-fold PLP-dependent enzyme [Elioraea sp.]